MRLIAVPVLILAFVSSVACASTSWGTPFQSYIEGKIWYTTFDWGINTGGPPDDSPVMCSTANCIVTVGTRSGAVPIYPGTCDSGGVCDGRVVSYDHALSSWVRVARGSSWEQAYSAFVAKYGTGGSTKNSVLTAKNVPPSNHPTWGMLCVGFMSLPEASALGQLAPSTTCGLLNPPDLQCNIDVTPVVDLGVINTGRHSLKSDAARLSIACSANARVTASLTREHTLAGVPLSMEIGGKTMSTSMHEIYNGSSTTLPVTVRATGDFESEGEFQESVPIIVTYY